MTPVVTAIEVELPSHHRGGVHLRVSTPRGNAGALFVSMEEAPDLVARLVDADQQTDVIVDGPVLLTRDFMRRLDLCAVARRKGA